VASTTLPEALTEPEAVGAQPVVLASGSSLLVHAPAPAAVGAVPVVLEDSNAPPADQPVPVWDLAELVQEATLSLDEIRSQLGMLEEDYRSFTTSEGQPFPSAWAFITAPEPEGRGCDLRALLASTAPLVTQLEQLQAAAVAPPVEQMTNVQRVLQVISELPVKFSPSHAAVRTGLTTDQARRTLRSLVENGALSKDEDGGYSKRRRTSSKNSARR
jgi:hypothetical protein